MENNVEYFRGIVFFEVNVWTFFLLDFFIFVYYFSKKKKKKIRAMKDDNKDFEDEI